MRKVKAILAAALGLAFVGSANAAIVLNIQEALVQPPSGGSAGSLPGHKGYIVSLVSDGQPITAVDIATPQGSPSTDWGIFGPMHQRWTQVPDSDPPEYSANPRGTANGSTSTTPANLDSHILIPNGSDLATFAPSENNNVSPSPLPDGSADLGYGSFLRYAAGLVTSSATTVPLAYIVMKDTDTIQIRGAATELNNPQAFTFSGEIVVPEPASASLLALGALGLLRRQRRA